MRVKELIDKLASCDPNLDVLCYTEDSELLPPNHLFRLLDIGDLNVTDAEKRRGTDEIPSFKLGRSDASQPHVLINVTADF